MMVNIIPKQGLRFCISLLFSCFIFLAGAHGQDDASQRFDAKKFRKQQQTFENKTGTRFRQSSPWICEDSSRVDIENIDGPFVLFLGYYGCAPCRVLMKSLDTVLQAEVYNDITFVYMTMDGTESIHEELNPLKNLQRMHRVIVTRDYINAHDLAMAYPTIYFVKSNRIINDFKTGGPSEHGPEVDAWWRQHLDALR